jgi:addiction module HigA family antidote
MSRRKIKSGLPAMHPGELLREDVIPALGRPHAEIARLLGVSRQTLHAILTERTPITPMMALRLGKLCGNGPDLWLALQARYDLQRLSKVKRRTIAAIPTLVTT